MLNLGLIIVFWQMEDWMWGLVFLVECFTPLLVFMVVKTSGIIVLI